MNRHFMLVHPGHAKMIDSGKVEPDRAQTLAGKRVVLFSNSKTTVPPFYDEVERHLRNISGVAVVERKQKHHAALGASEEAIASAAQEVDFAVNAIGD